MNRSRIEYCDHTYNPITGCRHTCRYCYARTMTHRFSGDERRTKSSANYMTLQAPDDSGEVYVLEKRVMSEGGKSIAYPFGFEPTYHRYRVTDCTLDKLSTGVVIFVGAMADMWGTWVPDQWIEEVLNACEKREQHRYLFLTKNPKRYTEYGVPLRNNFWYGTTITSDADADRFNSLPAFAHTFVSVEPLLGDFADKHDVMFKQVNWIIIGAETGNRQGKVTARPEWVENIVRLAKENSVPVFMKDSLIPIVGEGNMLREYPAGMCSREVAGKLKAKLTGKCISCKRTELKREMMSVTEFVRRGKIVQAGYICKKCYREMVER